MDILTSAIKTSINFFPQWFSFFSLKPWEFYPKPIEANYQVWSQFNPIWKDGIEEKKNLSDKKIMALLQSTKKYVYVWTMISQNVLVFVFN
jgi:hypothetical protein